MGNEKLVYIPDFYSRQDADELFEFIRSQPHTRPDNMLSSRRAKSKLRRLSFPGYAPSMSVYYTDAQREECGGTMIDAPPLHQKFTASLSSYAGRLINHTSSIGYMPDDHMAAHQHISDDRKLGPGNQAVWVLSMGAVHPVKITTGSTQAVASKKTGRIKPKFVPDGGSETIFPVHGSLYILPSSFNEAGSGNEHEHAVLPGEDYRYGGLRISINAKAIPPGLSQDAFDAACSRPAGRTNAHTGSLIVEPGDAPRIYDCHSGKRWPESAVYVGREVISRQTGEVTWAATPYGNHKGLHGQDWIDETNRLMADEKFAAKMREDLRGKPLLCWCNEKERSTTCHARIWLKLANE